MPGLIRQAGAKSRQNRRQQTSAYLSSMQMSLLYFLSPTCLWCPAWLGRNLFQRSCLDRLMNFFI